MFARPAVGSAIVQHASCATIARQPLRSRRRCFVPRTERASQRRPHRRCLRDRPRGPFQHQQPCTGDLARALRRCRSGRTGRDGHAQPGSESRVPRAARATALSRAVGTRSPIGWPAGSRGRARGAVPDAFAATRAAAGSSPRMVAPSVANRPTAARSDQVGIVRESSRSIVGASCWKVFIDRPGATGRVPARVRAENAVGLSSAATRRNHATHADAREVRRPFGSSSAASAAASAARSRSV